MPVTLEMLEAAARREAELIRLAGKDVLPSESVRYRRPPSAPGYKELGLTQDWNWKAHLRTAPFELRKWFELSMIYDGASRPRSIRLMRLAEGYGDYYLRSWCLLRAAARTFALSNVGPLLTETGKFYGSGAAWLNSLTEISVNSLTEISSANAGLEELEWRKWRNSLKLVPIVIQGMELWIKHGSEDADVLMVAEAILDGPNGTYVDGFCPALNDRRTWAIPRIERVKTVDGVVFENFWEWVVNRVRIAPIVADDMGFRVPPESERR